MKVTLQEFGHQYKKYLFGYTLHALREAGDAFDDVYARGFLPFTGNTEVKDIYYMARSSRIVLQHFTLTSENRRIQRKFPEGTFLKSTHHAREVINDEFFLQFCLNYFEKRHGEGIFSRERLQFILSFFADELSIIKYEDKGKPAAYIVQPEGQNTGQYWFSFFDLNYSSQSIGTWLMLDCILAAKQKGLMYYYLGTVYGEKALYKTNFTPLEYWDGNAWKHNIVELKRLARSDKEREVLPLFR